MKTSLKLNTDPKKKQKQIKVSVGVEGHKENKFSNGKQRVWFTVYDVTPDQVLEVIGKAIQKA